MNVRRNSRAHARSCGAFFTSDRRILSGMILAGALMLLSYPVRAEISAAVVTDRILIQLSSDGTYSHSVSSGACSTPDCSLSITLVDTISYGPYYEGAGSASKTNVSGNLRRFYNDMNVNGTNNVESKSRVYAKVPPGQPVIIKVPASAHVAWNNMSYVYGGPILTAWAVAELTNPQMTVANSTGSSSNVSLPTSSDSQSKTLAIEATATGEPVSIGGEDYYLVGRINLRGRIHIRRYGGPSPDASFSASVGQPEVRYKGKVLKYESGGGQTWLVGQPLPAQLAVRVTQDDTGQPAPGETITFQIQDPVNGATLSGVTATTDAEGIARTTLTLGSSPGLYTVKASCPGCVASASTINFTAEAKAREAVIKLVKVSGDGDMPAGEKILNPLKVQAFNTLTEAGESGLDVAFSVVSFPSGGENADIGAPYTTTNGFGIAESSFTVGMVEGEYVVRAVCDACQANKEVLFILTGRAPIENTHTSAGVEKITFTPPDSPGEISALRIAFQNESMKPSFKAIPRDDTRIGVLKGDVLTFRGLIAPADATLSESDYVWSGATSGTGKTIYERSFNTIGTFDLTLTVKGKTRTVKITVAEIGSAIKFTDWLWDNKPYATNVLSCGYAALQWAGLYGPAHNNVPDAMRHAYWSACITNLVSEEVARAATNSYEFSSPNMHNEHVMDLENNQIGRNIGGNFPPLIGAAIIQEEIKATARGGSLTILDSPSNNKGEGLLTPSW
jgi:hypothetical protein